MRRRQTHHPMRNHAGFTLIEIVLALLVVTVGIVAMTGLLATSLDTSTETQDDLRIVGFAELVLNHLHARSDFGSIPASGTLAISDYAGGTANLEIGPATPFEYRLPGATGAEAVRYPLTYRLAIRAAGNILEVLLEVWPGYGTAGNPRIFYTELYDWPKL